MSDFMVIELLEEEKKTQIVMPDSIDKTQDPSAIFIVKAIGPGYHEYGDFISPDVEIGDKVFVTSYGVSKLEHEGKKVILARARDVILKIQDESEVRKDEGI